MLYFRHNRPDYDGKELCVNSASCPQDDKTQDYKLVVLLLSYYLYLLKQKIPEITKFILENGKDMTSNITIRPYNVNVAGKIRTLEFYGTTSTTLFTVPAGKKYVLFTLTQYSTTAATNTVSDSGGFVFDTTPLTPSVPYVMNINVVFEAGESLLWSSSNTSTNQIVKVFYIEFEDTVPLFSFKESVVTGVQTVLMQANASKPALIICGYNGSTFFNIADMITPSTSTLFSCNPSGGFYSSQVLYNSQKISAGDVIFQSSASPTSFSTHVTNYGYNGQSCIIGPGDSISVIPNNDFNVYGTYYQF
jgi:hypothetical protein